MKTTAPTPPIPNPKFATSAEAKAAGYFQLTDPVEIPGESWAARGILDNFEGSKIEVCTVGDQHSRSVWRKGKRSDVADPDAKGHSRKLRELFGNL